MSVVITGGDKLMAKLDSLPAEVRQEVSKAFTATGLELRSAIIKGYNHGPATGITYKKSNPTRTHRASAAGEAPMTDTGRTANATSFEEVGPLSVQVVNRQENAVMLEYGTLHIKPRPLWVPEAEKAEPKLRKRVEKALGDAVK